MFDDCYAAHSDDLMLVLKCVANWMETENLRLQQQAQAQTTMVTVEELNTWMLLLAGSLVFFMQAGTCSKAL